MFEVAATLNGVTYAPTSAIATPIPDSATSNSTSSSSGAGTPLLGGPGGTWGWMVPLVLGGAIGAWTVL